MPSILLITSPSNLGMLKKTKSFLLNGRFEITLLEDYPKGKLPKPYEGRVYGLGGGAVIDMAKLVSGDKPCWAIPTTASGAAMTTHAVLWTKNAKIDIPTPRPNLLPFYKDMPIKLGTKAMQRTTTDCFCHILESYFSKKANVQSMIYCQEAFKRLARFKILGNHVDLIDAGNYAGMAIEITGTNFIHAISYVLTLDYGLTHGDALKAAINIHKRKDSKEILNKASQYKKYHESTLV